MIYAREQQEGMYTPLPFYFAKVLSQCPFEILFAGIFWSIAYWMSGLNPNIDRFLMSLLILVLNTYCSQWLGYAFSSALSQLPTANLAANVTFTLFSLTSAWAVSPKILKMTDIAL